MNANDVIPVQADANTWNAIMSLLAEAPYKLAAPHISMIQMQCVQWDQRRAMPEQAGAPTPNVVPMRVPGGAQGGEEPDPQANMPIAGE